MKIATISLLTAMLCMQAAEPPSKTQWMDIVLERKEASNWAAVDPGLVLNQGDAIRFRFRSNFDGYLYVTNRGSSGAEMLLFPRQETGQANRIHAGKEYLIPATETQFRVSGPAGFDSIFWLVSPVALTEGPSASKMPGSNLPPNVHPEQPPMLTPRCDPAQLRARGLCIDSGAGVHNVEDLSKTTGRISQTPNLQPRDLTMIQEKNKTRVSTGGSLGGPAVYEFRVAHK